jgi:hypothetical protein
MKTLLGAFIILWSLSSGASLSGVLTKTPVDQNSVGCGILKGRLVYLEKTHEEVDSQIDLADNRYDLALLKILAKRYPQTFQEDQGYNIKVTWELGDKAADISHFNLTYPGMIWETEIGQMPERVSITQVGTQVILQAQINSYDYCLDSNVMTLNIADKANPNEKLELRATWRPELTL